MSYVYICLAVVTILWYLSQCSEFSLASAAIHVVVIVFSSSHRRIKSQAVKEHIYRSNKSLSISTCMETWLIAFFHPVGPTARWRLVETLMESESTIMPSGETCMCICYHGSKKAWLLALFPCCIGHQWRPLNKPWLERGRTIISSSSNVCVATPPHGEASNKGMKSKCVRASSPVSSIASVSTANCDYNCHCVSQDLLYDGRFSTYQFEESTADVAIRTEWQGGRKLPWTVSRYWVSKTER